MLLTFEEAEVMYYLGASIIVTSPRGVRKITLTRRDYMQLSFGSEASWNVHFPGVQFFLEEEEPVTA